MVVGGAALVGAGLGSVFGVGLGLDGGGNSQNKVFS
ncbi:hypothetical protein DEAC_c32530 [Desulfosporosinus acididurans]|uniref:Uncharacterized protein n=1 Tax=Desulfosporosinus acididurans TaxID=476652 RepID=A0A0J1IJN7_9FIRM|nr:hypothetical protein DEAC_c32530 [Desulfosporosinus acididurans]